MSMTFQLTDEQLMIQAMAREFSRKVLAPTAMERDRTGEFPTQNIKKMGELGFMGMMIPPEYGGEGAGRHIKHRPGMRPEYARVRKLHYSLYRWLNRPLGAASPLVTKSMMSPGSCEFSTHLKSI